MKKKLLLLILLSLLCTLSFGTGALADDTAILQSSTEDSPICTTVEEGAAVIREGMKEKQSEITFTWESSSWIRYDDFFNLAFSHTGDAKEGDYLKFSYAGYTPVIDPNGTHKDTDGDGVKDLYHYTYTYKIDYYTDAAQDAELDAAVSSLLAELDLEDKSDYEKVCSIYDYICNNIGYDYDNLDDTDYTLKYTAYAALVNKTAVCQGYAVLLYRLLLEEGIDNRVIPGVCNGGGHAWNIVKLEGQYYDVDVTWDAVRTQAGKSYRYFLKCEDDFDDHTRDSTGKFNDVDYTSDYFQISYPMADENFDHAWDDGTVTTPASCTENGVMTYTCTACGAEKTKVIRAAGHSFTDYVYNNDATYLANGTKTAECDNGCGAQDTKEAAGTMKKLASPSISTLTNTAAGIRLSWKKTSGADGYYIYRKLSGAAGYTKACTLTRASQTVWTDTHASNGKNYVYKVKAYNSAQQAASSENNMVRLTAVSVTRLSNLSGRKLSLCWKRNKKATGYRIAYAYNSSFRNAVYKNITSGKTVSKTLTKLTKGKTCYIKIRAYKTVNGNKYYGSWSAVKKIRIRR